MLKRLASGLIYDDFNDNLGQLIGGIIGTRIADTEANRLAKEKLSAIDQAKADQWNADNASEIADSNFGFKQALSGISAPDATVSDSGQLDVSTPTATPPSFKSFDTSAFTNKFDTNLNNNTGIGFDTNAVSKDLFMNRNRNRLPNAFSKLS